jgi:nucleoside-diphosphate-sugar epimerase
MEKVLIIGSAGFVGSHLSERIISCYEVIGIDNLVNGRLYNLKNLLTNKNFSFIEKDIAYINYKEIPFKIKAVYHLAFNYNSYIQNIRITKKILNIARKMDVEKFIFMSSTKAIGLITSKKPLNELTSCIPYDQYGKVKLECEKLVKYFCERYGIKYYIFRPPRIFGPRDWQKTFVNFSNLILNTNVLPISNIKINLVYVKNLVEALCFVLKKNIKSGTYILSDGAFSISKISLTIAKLLRKKCLLKINVPKFVFLIYSLFTGVFTHARKGVIYSSNKFRKDFNFKPTYTFYEGMKETLSYFNIIKYGKSSF